MSDSQLANEALTERAKMLAGLAYDSILLTPH